MTQISIDHFSSIFGNENHMVLTIPARMRQTLIVSHKVIAFFFLGRKSKAQRLLSRSNLCESPQQSRGVTMD